VGRWSTIAACALTVALASAAGAIMLFARSPAVAVGGPLAMHPQTVAPTPENELQLPDGLPTSPGAPPVSVAVPTGPHLTAPILYYHYVRAIVPTPQNLLSFDLSISPTLFAEQMALLHLEGAHPVTLATLMNALAGKQALPAHPVVLTFDDGYADFATAVEPVMARYGFVATDFVVSGFVNRPRYMTAAQLQQMVANGMVIGSHTVHHVDLARMPLAAAGAEIDSSKAALEKLLGQPVLDFAYPYGGVDAAIQQLVQQAGYRDAVSTIPGDVQSLNGRFAFRRVEIGGAPALAEFARDAGLPPPSPAQVAQLMAIAQRHLRIGTWTGS
jgi:peptidoglycan/xylan/chitin deacetylase (PgdA/CDA1 family)